MSATPESAPSEGPPTPDLVVRPKFSPALLFRSHAPLFVFLSLWGGTFFGGTAFALSRSMTGTAPDGHPILVAGALSLFLSPVAVLWILRHARLNTSYAFHGDRLACRSGGRRGVARDVPLAAVVSVRVAVSAGQARAGLGTVCLDVEETARDGESTRVCVRLEDVEHPESLRASIEARVATARGRRLAPAA